MKVENKSSQVYRDYMSNVERKVGKTIVEIQSCSPEKMKKFLREKNNKPFSFTTVFPIIGRGNVLRDSLATTEQINTEIDIILSQ